MSDSKAFFAAPWVYPYFYTNVRDSPVIDPRNGLYDDLLDASIDDYLEMYARAFRVDPERADRVMEAWDSGRIEAEYAYCAWALVVVGGDPYLGMVES